MIWFFLLVFLFAFLMGIFQVSIWIMYVVLVVVVVFLFVRNPLLFGKDPEKTLEYLKKSKSPQYQFLYHALNEDFAAAQQLMGKIRSKKFKQSCELMLLMERKEYGKAKELVTKMSDNKTKWYSLADIAINEGDDASLKHNKAKLTDTFYLCMLEVDQSVYGGKKEEAVTRLDRMIPRLRGYKLLSAYQYRKQILEGKI
jgi:hypothetical protein